MILVTGASGSIGSRLVDRLVEVGQAPRVAGRHPDRLTARWPQLSTAELDVTRPATLAAALDGVNAAYYLVHSMEPGADGRFRERDAQGARNFARAAMEAGVQRVIYLGGSAATKKTYPNTWRAGRRPGGSSLRRVRRSWNSELRW